MPPSSSVTGVRLRAQLAITALPVAGEPVKNRWSNGSVVNAGPRPPPSSKNASLSAGKYLPEIAISRRARWLEFSDILTMARLPAATTPVSGEKTIEIGKFHGTTMPATPSGCGITRARASGYCVTSRWRFCGFIHFFRCLIASRMPSWLRNSSAKTVSKRERHP